MFVAIVDMIRYAMHREKKKGEIINREVRKTGGGGALMWKFSIHAGT